jgi:amino acid adenylation domain-containing protein
MGSAVRHRAARHFDRDTTNAAATQLAPSPSCERSSSTIAAMAQQGDSKMISMSTHACADEISLADVSDLVSLLRMRVDMHGDDAAYVFLGDGERESARLSFGELDRRARAIAARLQDRLGENDRALLLYPPGLDYIEAFFACLYAGVIAVPAYPPSGRHLQRLQSIISDASPTAIMTTEALREKFDSTDAADIGADRLPWISTDRILEGEDAWRSSVIRPERLAFLQYTSGSTGAPRGVMVSHGNLLANQALIRESFSHDRSSTLVGWLPLYHDMGLIGNILQPLFVGATAVLMSPMSFLERPIRWLRAISHYRAHTSGGPNFAFDLCTRKITDDELAGLDLQCWRIAFSGAEPVRATTLERFAGRFRAYGFESESFYPCYGLAEATLVVTAPTARRPYPLRHVDRAALEDNRVVDSAEEQASSLVGCGDVWSGHSVTIVDPDRLVPCVDGGIGEIWVAGPSVAQGYWRRAEATDHTFHATLETSPGRRFLRTGDLGFMQAGELYITGRLKDLVIIAGKNYYPQDFEAAAEEGIEELRSGASAAFSAQLDEQESLVFVGEPQRAMLPLLRDDGAQSLFQRIREVLVGRCGMAPSEIILIKPGSIPKTSSGKIRRAECRRRLVDGALEIIARSGRASALVSTSERPVRGETESDHAQALLRDALSLLPRAQKEPLLIRFLLSTIAKLMGVSERDLNADASAPRNGLDSLRLIELKHAIDSLLGADVPLSLLLSDVGVTTLAKRLAEDRFEAMNAPTVAPNRRASFTQQAMWTMHALEPKGGGYNLHLALRIVGGLDDVVLKASIDDILERHSALRSVYRVEDGQLVVVTQPRERLGDWFFVVDASDWSSDELQLDMSRRAQAPFDLEAGPVFRAHLYQSRESHPILLLCVHHIALDLWSLLIVLDELRIVYSARRRQRSVDLPALGEAYQSYAAWQRRHVESPAGVEDWEYWRDRLGGDLPILALPLDHPRSSGQRYDGSSLVRMIDAESTATAKRIARENGATLFALLLAVYQITLYRYTHQRDIVIGTASSGRSREQFKGVVGNFVNPIALRLDLSPNSAFSTHLQQVRDCVHEALMRQDFPFSEIVERLRPEREEGRWPIFQTWFALQKAQSGVDGGYAQLALGEDTNDAPWGELQISGVCLRQRIERFDLKLMAAETEEGAVLSFQYRRDLFEAATIAGFADYFERVLDAVLRDPERPLGAIGQQALPAGDRAVPTGRSPGPQTPDHSLVHEQIAAWARKTPGAIAVVAGVESITYAELDAAAERLAGRLRRSGVAPDAAVAVHATRSIETIVAILGILKSGGAYLPFDPETPVTRIAQMLSDARARALCCAAPRPEWTTLDIDCPIVSLDASLEPGEPIDPISPGVTSSENLAYIIFTSGSTGAAKGVAVTHASLMNYARAISAVLGVEAGARFAVASTLAADLGHTSVFPSLMNGGRLHVLSDEQATDPRAFEACLRDSKIDILKIVPSHYSALCPPVGDHVPTPRKALVFGGEALPVSLARRVAASTTMCRQFNHYGPTETTVGALMLPLTREFLSSESEGTAPIGRPLHGMKVYILDRDGLPTPPRVAGEICLSGAGVARGYVGRPELTAERFLPDPYGALGERLYRTGDLGAFDESGNVEFLGRIDQQIKLHGYRIELGEIEGRLRDHPDIAQAAVAAVTHGGQTRLVAHVVATGAEAPSFDALRAHLRAALPDYMTPAVFNVLSALPMTANGKIDRRRLPAPIEPVASDGGRSPRNRVEARLARIFAETLGLDAIGVDDNFFSSGGDSITSIQVASRAYAEGLAITARQIYRYQTIEALAAALASEQTVLKPVEADTRESCSLTSAQIERLGHEPARIEDAYPATPLQAGLLFHSLSEPNSGVYIMQHRYWIEGDVQVEAFRRAWQAVSNAHSIFRTSFAWDGLPGPHQLVHRDVELPFDYSDWRSMSEGERAARLDRLLAEERREGFALSRAPLVRIRLFRLEDRRYLLIRSHHHILFDAWCTSLILDEVRANYEAFVSGSPAPARNTVGFRSYIEWLQRQDIGAAEPFWRDYLRGFDEPTPLFAKRSNARDVGQVADETILLSPEATAALERAAKTLHVTVNTFAQAALALLLARYTNRRDILFGVTVSGRPADLPNVESMLGLFINALPLRVAIESDRPLSSLLESVLANNYAMRDYEYVSLTQIREWSEIPTGVEMFHYLLTFENAPVDRRLLEARGDWRFTDCWHRTHTNYPITFVVIPGNRLHLQVTYARSIVEPDVAARLLAHYRRLLEEMALRPNARLGDLGMIMDDERRTLVERWNQTHYDDHEPRDIIGRFEMRASSSPDAIAARCGEAFITYRDLALRARRVAAALIRAGVEPDEVVVLLDHRGIDFLVMMLALFHAGAGYLPLEPAYPDGRLAQILAESKAVRMLVGRSFLERASAIVSAVDKSAIELLELGALESASEASAMAPARFGPNNLAFVIFTSGSTGRPKGVVVERLGMFNNLITKERVLRLTALDVVAQTASQCFDISVWQFLTPLAVGARVEVFPDAVSRDPERLLKEIDAKGVTILEAVPSMIRALLDASDPGAHLRRLRWLLPCGEAFAPELCRLFMARYPHVGLLNAYGPAECSDDVSYHLIEAPPEGDDLSVPIGAPVDNTLLYIIDRWLDLAPIGVAGEIAVAGIQVGRGYLNRPDLTAASFVPNPFGHGGQRLYRTGDLGRRRSDGVIEFLGRIDHQVKIRGNRIELGEIEARIASHPDVRSACAVIHEVAKGVHRLVAYVESDSDRCSVDELRRHIRAALPEYMVPEAFVRLDALPLSTNGKVDRKALPAPELERTSSGPSAARSPTEETITQIWMDLLGVAEVGTTDNFFDLGGHSLLAARVASRIRSIFAIDLPLRAVLDAADLADLAARVDEARGRPSRESSAPIARASRHAAISLSHAQQRLWFVQQLDPQSSAYNLKLAIRAIGPLDDGIVEVALNVIVGRHESLRTLFEIENGRPVQRIAPSLTLNVHREAVDRLEETDQELIRRMTEFASVPYDLTCGPLLRCAIYRPRACADTASSAILLFGFHHIVFDGWSYAVFLREFAAIYSSLFAGREARLPPMPIQYADYAVWDAGQAGESAAARQLAYWREQLRDAPGRVELPADRPGSSSEREARTYSLELSDIQPAFDAFNRAHAVTPFMTMLSVWATQLRFLSGASDIVVGSVVANRPRVELESVIGCFVNQVALRMRLEGNPSFREVVERARGVTLSAYDHQAFPFDRLVEELKPERELGSTPFFRTSLAFHNFPMPELEIADLRFEHVRLDAAHAELDLILHIYRDAPGWRADLQYRAGLFDTTTIERFARLFQAALRMALDDPEIRLDDLLDSLSTADAAICDAIRSRRRSIRHAQLGRVDRRKLRL